MAKLESSTPPESPTSIQPTTTETEPGRDAQLEGPGGLIPDESLELLIGEEMESMGANSPPTPASQELQQVHTNTVINGTIDT